MLFRKDFTSAPWMRLAINCLGLHGPPHDSFFHRTIRAGTVRPAANKYGHAPTAVATPAVMEFFQAVEDGTYGEDWCAAFVTWCLNAAHVPTRRSSGARFFLSWGKPVMPTWGSVAILYYGSHKSTHKHVGFLVEHTKDRVVILGGNQRVVPASSADHAVTLSARSIVDVQAYRWPTAWPVPVWTNDGKHFLR